MNNTPNYGLKQPAEEDFYNIQDFNDNMDIVDVELKITDQKATHINREALDGITKEKMAEWDEKATLSDITTHNEDSGAHTTLQNKMEELESRANRLEDMMLADIKENPYLFSLETLDGLIVEGVYNEEKQRIEF